MAVIRLFTVRNCSASAASILLMSITSACEICRCAVETSSSLASLSATLGFSSRLKRMFRASTSVTMPSRYRLLPRPSSSQKRGASDPGLARPLVSRMILSRGARRFRRDSIAATEASLMEQQIHPFGRARYSEICSPLWETVKAFSISAAAYITYAVKKRGKAWFTSHFESYNHQILVHC